MPYVPETERSNVYIQELMMYLTSFLSTKPCLYAFS